MTEGRAAASEIQTQSPEEGKADQTRPDTKTRILDEAEKLFGLNGFQATSLRDITRSADVNLAAVNYHFQSKDSLIDAVIARRIEPVNAERLRLLDEAGPKPTLEQVLRAFLKPVYDRRLDAIVPLLGRVLSNPDLFVDRVFNRHLRSISMRFGEELTRLLPGLPRTELLWRLHFSVGVMTHTLLWGKIFPVITGGLCHIDDRESLLARTVQFLAAGFRAPLDSEVPRKASRLTQGGEDNL